MSQNPVERDQEVQMSGNDQMEQDPPAQRPISPPSGLQSPGAQTSSTLGHAVETRVPPEQIGAPFQVAPPAVNVWYLHQGLAAANAMPDESYIKMFLERGFMFKKLIKAAKARGEENIQLNYVNTAGSDTSILLEISGDTIPKNALTKNRFLAVCHLENHLKSYGHKSSLFAGVDWSRATEQYGPMMRDLAGIGFQFMGKVIRDHLSNNHTRDGQMEVFWLTCHMMDFLALTGTIKNKKLQQTVGNFTLEQYMTNPSSYLRAVPGAAQTVVNGAAMNMGLSGPANISNGAISVMSTYLLKEKPTCIGARMKGMNDLIRKALAILEAKEQLGPTVAGDIASGTSQRAEPKVVPSGHAEERDGQGSHQKTSTVGEERTGNQKACE